MASTNQVSKTRSLINGKLIQISNEPGGQAGRGTNFISIQLEKIILTSKIFFTIQTILLWVNVTVMLLTILTVWFPLLIVFSTARLPSQIFLFRVSRKTGEEDMWLSRTTSTHISNQSFESEAEYLSCDPEKCDKWWQALLTRECVQSRCKCRCASRRKSPQGQLT